MLNREFLRFHRKGDRALPLFVSSQDPELLVAAENVLAVYRTGLAMHGTRGALEEKLEPLKKSRDEAGAFAKILEDRSRFSEPANGDSASLRAKLFEKSGQLLNQADSPEKLRGLLAEDPDLAAFLREDIYGDLPQNRILAEFRDMTAQELLERYNVAQVQGILLYAKNLRLAFQDADAAELRRFFRYLKFFRLLASVRRAGNVFFAEISGPLALFENTRKYAVQLASLVPAVFRFKRWRLSAEIEWKNRNLRLLLDEKSGLQSHYRNFSAYIPEEIMMFCQVFKSKISDWKLAEETDFLEAPDGEIFFPDFSFREISSGRTIHLELFHRWHRGALEKRLKMFAVQQSVPPLILGVDRSIAGEKNWTEYMKQYPFLQDKWFLFRDFPGADRVAGMLRKAVQNC